MRRQMLKSKIHRVVVTSSDPDYEGSVSVDSLLLDEADIVELEAIHVWNVTRGTRLVTYAIRAPAGSGTVCLNGAAARLNEPGDIVILATFADVDEDEVPAWRAKVVHVDARNRSVRHASA